MGLLPSPALCTRSPLPSRPITAPSLIATRESTTTNGKAPQPGAPDT
jgi:hypothetical protein